MDLYGCRDSGDHRQKALILVNKIWRQLTLNWRRLIQISRDKAAYIHLQRHRKASEQRQGSWHPRISEPLSAYARMLHPCSAFADVGSSDSYYQGSSSSWLDLNGVFRESWCVVSWLSLNLPCPVECIGIM